VTARAPRIRFLPLVLLLGLAVGAWSPAAAAVVTIHDIDDGFARDPHYGEIIREIHVEGNNHTKEEVILEAMSSKVGESYTRDHAELDSFWITRLGAFTMVSFAVEPVVDGIALTVRVAETSPYIPSISFAITQENGVEIGPAVSSSNLFGTAARASVYARFGGATNIGLKYSDPRVPTNRSFFSYRFEYFHRERQNELMDFGESTDEILLELKRVLSGDMRGGGRIRYLGLASDTEGVTLSGGRDNIPSFGLFLEYDSRNSVYPTKGWLIDGEIARYGIANGDADYWRVDADFRRYAPLAFLGPRHSLALYSYTTLVSGTLGEGVPYHQEFYVGGTNSVRGWSLGSRHGQNQWLNTIEYWYRLMDQKAWHIWFIKLRMGFQLGAFFDAGTAWSENDELDSNWIGGGGVGFRLTLPIVTVVRFDAAVGENSLGFRIFIGGGEKAEAQKQRVR